MADGESTDALDLAEMTLEFWRTQAGDEPIYEVAWTLEQLGLLYQKADQFEDGEAALREAIEIHEQVDTPESLDLGKAKTRLARLLLERGRAQEALEQADQAVKLLEERAPIEGHWRTLHAKAVLGGALAAVGRLEDARTLLEEVYTKLRSIRGDLNEETVDARRYLTQLYKASGEGVAAERLNRQYLKALETGGRRLDESENSAAVQE